MKWKVGQKLWMVRNRRHGEPCEVEVIKVGRKWATINAGYPSYRIDDNGRIDGRDSSSPGACYESRSAYEYSAALYKAWVDFRADFTGNISDGVTIEDIDAARALLKVGRRPA